MKVNSGVYTALITPFNEDGSVDYQSFESLIDFQWKNGIKNFVVNGTTAESPTLEKQEVEKLYDVVRNYNKDTFIVLGTGSNSTRSTIKNTQWAKELGCDGALVVVPYYNKPTQLGMAAHFKAVADSSEIPIILYNVPGRTVVSMDAFTASTLSQHSKIVATKEASGDLSLMKEIKEKSQKDFKILSGDDDSCLDLCLSGGHGVISVMSHIIPKQTVSWIEQAMNGNDACISEFKKYKEFLKYLYIEPNPVPAKMALYLMGIIKTPAVRLPLLKITEPNSKKLNEILKGLKII